MPLQPPGINWKNFQGLLCGWRRWIRAKKNRRYSLGTFGRTINTIHGSTMHISQFPLFEQYSASAVMYCTECVIIIILLRKENNTHRPDILKFKKLNNVILLTPIGVHDYKGKGSTLTNSCFIPFFRQILLLLK